MVKLPHEQQPPTSHRISNRNELRASKNICVLI